MIEAGHRTLTHSPEARPDLSLTYLATTVRWAGRFGGFGLSYLRPTLATSSGSGVAVPIRDHVMLIRLAVFALLSIATIWRWVR